MKTSILIAGVCLLALTSTITEALHKKQDAAECASLTLDSDVQSCLPKFASRDQSACTGSCKNTLENYYTACDAREAYDIFCDEFINGGNGGGDNGGGDNGGGDNDGAATVGVTLFTIVSAALVAVGN